MSSFKGVSQDSSLIFGSGIWTPNQQYNREKQSIWPSKNIVFQNFREIDSSTIYTISAKVGEPAPNRKVIVAVHSEAGSVRTISSATIDGISANIYFNSSRTNIVSFLTAPVTSNKYYIDVVVTFSGSTYETLIGVYSFYGNSHIPVSTNSSTSATNINSHTLSSIQSDDSIIAACITGSGVSSTTWTDMDATYSRGNADFDSYGAKDISTETSKIITATFNTTTTSELISGAWR